ncbi:unnamed protein product [Polarella glacialis]|uniref:RRM domain-containing protein n=1 Tax=Polarella glacialis TaxID=89957 RepID=A0A813KUE7_POLGL|nr:unnamed protein product [Polarella glacialis]CAE8708632.1 unnamed protein product [Polarella glacialis]
MFSAVKVKNTFLEIMSDAELEDEAATPMLRQQSEPCKSGVLPQHGVPFDTVLDRVSEKGTTSSKEIFSTAQPTCHESFAQWPEGVVTIMIRNLPNRYKQEMVLDEVGRAGFLDAFDILYLPLDPKTGVNRGYAFMNFKTALKAIQFKEAFEGYRMKKSNSRKNISVVPAKLQGFDAVYAKMLDMQKGRTDLPCPPCVLKAPTPAVEPPGDAWAAHRPYVECGTDAKGYASHEVKQPLSYPPQNEAPPQQRAQLQLHLLLNSATASCKDRATLNFCSNCGTQVPDMSKDWCGRCGHSVMKEAMIAGWVPAPPLQINQQINQQSACSLTAGLPSFNVDLGMARRAAHSQRWAWNIKQQQQRRQQQQHLQQQLQQQQRQQH